MHPNYRNSFASTALLALPQTSIQPNRRGACARLSLDANEPGVLM
jgi:hypothetical protein